MAAIKTLASRSRDVLHLVLDEPGRRNPIDHDVFTVIEEAVLGEQAAVVVLSATPGPAFCAGGDLRLDAAGIGALSDRVYDFCLALPSVATVFVVAADGVVMGSGAQLFLAADLRAVGRGTSLRVADPARGLAVGTWALPWFVGRARATRLLLTGEPLDADQLVMLGFAESVSTDPTAQAERLAEALAQVPVNHRRRVKRALAAAMDVRPAVEFERASFERPTDPREWA